MHYPENSEYEYLSWLIYDERVWKEETLVEPIRDRYREAYRTGKSLLAAQLWEQEDRLLFQIVEQMRVKEEIIYWLYLDQQLRQEGKTYPDVYEQRGWSQCSSGEGF